jgi:RHS repeat-associated protein
VSYSWDALNRLVQVSGPAGTVRYVYDGEGHRVQQVTPAGTYNYLVDRVAPLPVVIREEGPEGTIDYVHGAGLISALGSTFQHFYQFDGVGSVVSVTDAAGALRQHYGYDPWGNPLWPDALGARNKYRFTSEPWDAASGLYHFRARYYDPTLGRFLSKDPVLGLVRDPATLHPYQYGLNSPLMLTDRTGRVLWWIPGAVGAMVSAVGYLIDVATGPETFSWATLAGRTAGGFVAAYTGPLHGLTSYLVDWGVQWGVSKVAQVVSGSKDLERFKAEEFSWGELATETVVGLITHPLSNELAKAIGPNVGRNPRRLLTILTGRQTQKAFFQAVGDEILERVIRWGISPGTALAPGDINGWK